MGVLRGYKQTTTYLREDLRSKLEKISKDERKNIYELINEGIVLLVKNRQRRGKNANRSW